MLRSLVEHHDPWISVFFCSPELKRRHQQSRKQAPPEDGVIKADKLNAVKRKAAFDLLKRRHKQKKMCFASSCVDDKEAQAGSSKTVSSALADPVTGTQNTTQATGIDCHNLTTYNKDKDKVRRTVL